MNTGETRKIEREKDTGNLYANSYLVLKLARFPDAFNTWERNGSRRGIKGIHNLVSGNGFDFVLGAGVKEDLAKYVADRKTKRRVYEDTHDTRG